MSTLSKEFIDFFKGLEKNNSKEWFDKNRKTYEQYVKKPFTALVEEMISRINKEEPEVKIAAKDAMFRINRDIRFSANKTPYQTHVSANISRGGRKSTDPGFYFQLSHKGIMVGGGAYFVEKEELGNIRSEIAASLKEFDKIISDKQFKSMLGGVQGEKNKIIPAELKDAAGKQPLIYNKQFYYMTELGTKDLTSPKLADLLMNYYKAGKKFNAFLRHAMHN